MLSRVRSTAEAIWDVIPSLDWLRYASMRLGAFLMSYAVTVAGVVILFASAGIVLSLGAVLAFIPIAVFLAIRISGVLTDRLK
jgi:hypothetical protein